MAHTIGILVFDGVDELDFVGPLDVFGAAAWGRDDTTVVTVGPHREQLRGVHGLRFLADYALTDAPPLDVVVVPGGLGVEQASQDRATLDWLRQAADASQWLCSVCNGTFLLNAAGLTTTRRVTTHSGAIEMLQAANAHHTVERARYIVDGNMVTAAGVSAGIDVSLWLVGQIYGWDHARNVRALIDYYPEPPV